MSFGNLATPVFVQEADDECSLYQNHRSNKHNLPLILLPQSRIAKVNLASQRQAALADAPALHLPPVKHRTCKLDDWHLDFARLLPLRMRMATAAVCRPL